MTAPARRIAYDLLRKVELEGLFSDDAVNSPAVACLDLRDRHLATELVMGTLRWQGLLDHVLRQASSKPWRGVDPRLRVLLRMSLHQMWQMDRIPDHALVNDAVEMVKRTTASGAGSFVNAILRRLGRERPWTNPGFLDSCPAWDRVSLPRWLWKRWTKRFGEERAREYALSLNEVPRMVLRVGDEAGDSDSLSGLEVVPSDLVPGAFLVRSGRKAVSEVTKQLRIQDEASQLIPYLLGLAAGWTIWDACAAPGGKSAILARIVDGGGWVISSDSSWARLRRMARTMSENRGAASDIVILDARNPPPFRALFDAVLADVPCSGSGTLRRKPEIKWRLRPEQLAGLASTQERILASVSESVRPGGLLLYSTCSTEPEENEGVVSAFLTRHPGFNLVRPMHPPGVEILLDQKGFLRTFPGTRLWDGFFAALMRRSQKA